MGIKPLHFGVGDSVRVVRGPQLGKVYRVKIARWRSTVVESNAEVRSFHASQLERVPQA